MQYIAITDHFSNSWKARVIPTLDSIEKIALYLENLKTCKKFLLNLNEGLDLFSGIEIDLGSSDKYIKNLINPEEYDLILFEYVETINGIAFVKKVTEHWKKRLGEEKLPLLGLAHFDPSIFMVDGFDLLITFLEEYDIYFEFNSRYPDYYSRKNELFFNELKYHDIPVAIGCDSHDLKTLDDYEEPTQMIDYYGLERNFVSTKFFDP